MITVSEALDIIVSNATPLASLKIPTEQALTYAVTSDIKADRPLPPFNRVAMDGFAVRSEDFQTSTVELTLKGQIQTGKFSELEVNSGEAVQIMTGAPCPKGADAVVKVENSEVIGDKVRLVEKKMKPGLNIAAKGEDTSEGDILIKAGTPLSVSGIAVSASVGYSEVEVFKKPRIKIISTGTEIIHPSQHPQPHQIRDCNSYTLRSMSNRYFLDSQFLGIGEDDPAVLSKLIKEGLNSEILILSGGVSMGEFDHIPSLLSENGVKNLFYKVKVKPGKPVWFGKSENGAFVFGLPGNPVSVQTCFRIFVEPLIKKLSGYSQPFNTSFKLPLAKEATSKTPRVHFMPGRLKITENGTEVEPVKIRGSGDFSNFVKSQGLFMIPAEIEQMKAGEMVDFLPWNDSW